MQVNKTYFHPRCMKCQVCDELQTSRYITYKDLPICEEDYKVCKMMMTTKEQKQQRGKILGDGRAKVLKKWEKWSSAYCCLDQLRCLKWAGKECDGEHICGGGEFMQMWIFGRCTGMVSLLVQRLFQVSHWPCICQSKSTCTHYWFSMPLYALHFTVLNSITKCVFFYLAKWSSMQLNRHCLFCDIQVDLRTISHTDSGPR